MSIRNELEKINAEKTEGSRIRAKAQFVEHNERSSKLFINLEKRNSVLKNITRLKVNENTEVTDSDMILKELSKFYEQLYHANEYNNVSENEFLSASVPKLSEEKALLCDAEISLAECSKALEKMK